MDLRIIVFVVDLQDPLSQLPRVHACIMRVCPSAAHQPVTIGSGGITPNIGCRILAPICWSGPDNAAADLSLSAGRVAPPGELEAVVGDMARQYGVSLPF